MQFAKNASKKSLFISLYTLLSPCTEPQNSWMMNELWMPRTIFHAGKYRLWIRGKWNSKSPQSISKPKDHKIAWVYMASLAPDTKHICKTLSNALLIRYPQKHFFMLWLWFRICPLKIHDTICFWTFFLSTHRKTHDHEITTLTFFLPNLCGCVVETSFQVHTFGA